MYEGTGQVTKQMSLSRSRIVQIFSQFSGLYVRFAFIGYDLHKSTIHSGTRGNQCLRKRIYFFIIRYVWLICLENLPLLLFDPPSYQIDQWALDNLTWQLSNSMLLNWLTISYNDFWVYFCLLQWFGNFKNIYHIFYYFILPLF